MPAGSVSSESSESSSPDADNVVTDYPMTAGVRSLWEHNQLLDYSIRVGHQEFKVHRVIMASMSDYFRAMLTGGMTESGKDVVLMEGVKADAMKTLIQYMYTNQMDISKDTAAEILNGAVYLQIQSAIDKCTKFIFENIDGDNCFDVLALFSSYGLVDAVRDVERYIKRNIREIVHANCMMELSYDKFSFVVGNWQSSEIDLFQLILKWSKAHEKARKNNLDDLLCLVRYSLMTPEQLSEVIAMKKPGDILKPWYPLIDKACEYHKLPIHQRVLDNSEQTKLRAAPSFVSFGDHSSETGYFYEPLQKHFVEHSGLHIPYHIGDIFGEIEINGFHVLNTPRNDQYGEEWHIFDPRTLKWEEIARLDRFSDYAPYPHNDKELFVVGGQLLWDETAEFTDTIEKYEFTSNKWSTFSRLPLLVKYCGACILNNKLYVSGGLPEAADEEDLDSRLSKMDCLDLSSGEWISKSPLISPRSHHAMHVMKILGEDVICVFDKEIDENYTHKDRTFQFEVYNPSKDEWSSCTFTLSKPLLLLPRSQKEWVRGNSLFIQSCREEVRWNHRNVSAVVTFADDSTDAKVVYIDELEERFKKREATVLQIAPHTNKMDLSNM